MIYYLVQGEAYQYADRIAEMADSGAEVIFLTWDKQIDGALFLPNSSMMQGRNFLLQHVLKNNYKFEYLVFIDGDAKPIKGSWRDFNNFLLERKPQICTTLMFWNINLIYRIFAYMGIALPMALWQRSLMVDMQVLAFRKDIIQAIGEVMHPTIFDNISWFHNGDIHLSILKYMVPHNIVQFNRLKIDNDAHGDYPKERDIKYINMYIKQIGLSSWFPFFENKIKFPRLIKIFKSFIELFYLIPFPIKEFDAAKRAEYVKQCLQKIKQPAEETTKTQQSCKSI